MLALFLVLALPGAAPLGQKKEPVVRLADDQQVDTNISEMLAGWQIGDVALMHKHYADDVMVVSGLYQPPLTGWTSYVVAYQQQRQRLQNVHLDRINTYINLKGNFAWVTYQWDFSALVDQNPTGARGHTTLVLEKRGDRWLIVHNHTSLAPTAEAPAPQPAPPAPKKPGA
jgi:ketosteroid isomerase-like protein